MNLDQFKAGLVNIIDEPSTMRPFVCEGSPLDCDVFIVGYNPATEMQGDWWSFWKRDYGFQKHMWKQEYLNQRGTAKLTKTRERIEVIVAGLSPLRVLEANIDARPSKRKSEYPRPVTTPFDYLLRACTPKVVIAHGVDAVAYLQNWKDGKVIKSKHFIYVGRERTAEIIADTRAAVRKSDFRDVPVASS
jgi:hypothetical protein